ncbi:MAG TPA: DUF6010 family protein [Gemmatimonadaceae bacterium]|nr:DUF6010 family protein [Gemmatimonadaceae bacterium]
MSASNLPMLLAGALGGALFVGIAFALTRRTRGILVRGMIVTALCYVYFAVKADAGPAWLAAELAGVALYGAMALRGLRGSAWWLVAAWGLHPVWDVALHLVGSGRTFAPAAFPIACLTWDPVVAGVVAAGILLRARGVVAPVVTTPAASAAAAPASSAARAA